MKGKTKKLIKEKEFKVSYRPICHSAAGLGELVRLLGVRLAGREEPGFKELKIKSQEGEKQSP